MIKRFAFRLDQVLRHRASVKELRERAFAEVEAALVHERQVREELLRMRSDMLDSLAGVQSSAFEAMERELYTQYLSWLSSEIEREAHVIEDLHNLLEEKRAELVKASQDHRIVERLKERQFGGYMKEVARSDQAALDEVTANAHVRGVRWMGAVAPGKA